MNSVILIGRLTRDPELRYTPNTQTAVAHFTLAIDRPVSAGQERQADFIRITVFGKQAETRTVRRYTPLTSSQIAWSSLALETTTVEAPTRTPALAAMTATRAVSSRARRHRSRTLSEVRMISRMHSRQRMTTSRSRHILGKEIKSKWTITTESAA